VLGHAKEGKSFCQMKKARFSVFALFLLLACCAFSQAQTQTVNYDGYWWNAETPVFKLGFVLGYVQGTTQVNADTFGECLIARYAKYERKRQVKVPPTDTNRECNLGSSWDGIKSGELQDGLDEFYKDFRNKHVFINQALPYVRDQINGKSSAVLDKELEEIRVTPRAANR
jgi:hypothetical protein